MAVPYRTFFKKYFRAYFLAATIKTEESEKLILDIYIILNIK